MWKAEVTKHKLKTNIPEWRNPATKELLIKKEW